MKLFYLLLGLIPKYDRNKNKLYDKTEIDINDMKVFDDDVILRFKYPLFNNTGYDNRYGIINDEKEDQKILYNINRFFYIQYLLKILNSDMHSQYKLEYIQEYEKYNNGTSFIPNIFEAGLLNDWNTEYFL